ncbi:MAG: hypothetical protein IJY39_12910 [Clostridia bacterium]|nr:hypothetical protein [Clostridia bacterium]
MNRYFKKQSFRIAFVVALFVVVCFVYVVRMVNISANADPTDDIQTGTYERSVPIQALRGEIYDRNGKLLVYNEYTYDMVFDYDAMAATQIERNYAILQAVYALRATGNEAHRTESSFPFDGAYPNYTYSAEARDRDSNIYYRLLKRIAQNELEEDAPVSKTELTASYLETFYAENPQEFPAEQEIVDWYLSRYKLNAVDSAGEALFSDSEIDTIIRVRYDMEVADFSIYTRYVMAKDLDISFITYIAELNVVGADFVVETERVYAYPGYASHILGRTGAIPSESWEYYKALGYEMNAVIGLDGCEAAFEEYLRGEDGVMIVTEDENGNIIDSRIEKEPVAGKDVYLTIDIDLQIAAEDGLAHAVARLGVGDAGALTAIDPDNGEVLALASYPTFDLSTYGEDYNELLANSANPLYNRALDGLYAPGSTFKIGMVAAGISSGTVKADTVINCTGRYTHYSDYQPRCWIYPGSHGYLNSMGALEVSCNCYFYELGRLMGIDMMNEYCTLYGLGQYTGIELGEKKGILAGPTYREENGLEGWTAGNTISAAIGQSDNTFTPIQVSVYVSTVLNGGTRYAAHLLKEVRSYKSEQAILVNEAEVLSQVNLTPSAVTAAKQGMKQMVQSSAAVSNYMSSVPVTVGGKTGTAQLGGSSEENGLFVCAAPYNDPEIVVTAVLEHAGGGTYAALVASYVLDAYYGVD